MAEKVIIIGSGPAGWTAAIYAARANLAPVLFEGLPSTKMLPGGQLMFTTEVENFPGYVQGIDGQTMMQQFREQAVRFGVQVRSEEITAVDFTVRPFRLTTSGDERVEAHSVIVATGACANWLGLPNEQRLAQSGGGVSACAVCDGALPAFRNRPLVVIGGGDSAMEEAAYLTNFASQVSIIHRRDELRASKIMQERVLANPKIKVEWNSIPVDILGEEYVEGIRLKDTISGEERDLECSGVFVAIGHTPNTAFLQGSLEVDDKGYLIRTRPFQTYTSVEGVFAAGDVADSRYRQAISAAGSGCMAALDAERWLAEQGL